VLGGDDGTQANMAPTEHKGFPRDVLVYDPQKNTWTRSGEVPFSIVTTTATTWQGDVVIPSGEQRPGVRTPAVWTGTPSAPR
jgi:N-acetylneuraminic acid mutarotase